MIFLNWKDVITVSLGYGKKKQYFQQTLMHSWFLGHKLDKNLKNKIKTSLWHVQDVFSFFKKIIKICYLSRGAQTFVYKCTHICTCIHAHVQVIMLIYTHGQLWCYMSITLWTLTLQSKVQSRGAQQGADAAYFQINYAPVSWFLSRRQPWIETQLECYFFGL